MKKYLTGLVIGFILAAGGVAIASIPDGGGVIHGCYKNSTGMLKVIDDATQSCAGTETALTWSQTGPQGITGATGPAGEDGQPQIYYASRITIPASTPSLGWLGRWVYLPAPITNDLNPTAGYYAVSLTMIEGGGAGQGFCPYVAQRLPSKFHVTLGKCDASTDYTSHDGFSVDVIVIPLTVYTPPGTQDVFNKLTVSCTENDDGCTQQPDA